jgi:flagellar basal-body rod protein FlgF
MDNTLYVGLSRQAVLQRALDVAANNIANQDTVGFKVEELTTRTDPIAPPRSSGSLTSPNLATVNYVLDTGVARDFGQGELSQTGNPLDVAIQGPGFFTLQTANGPRYTRDGRFTLDPQNQIVDQKGEPVLSTSGTPIVVNPQQGPIMIAKDGSVSQSANGQSTQIAQIGVVQFANLSALSKQGSNQYSETSGQAAAPVTNAKVMQGFVEHSNVNPVKEVTSLISISRAYDRMQDIMSSTQDLSSKAVDSLGQLQQ